MHALRCLEGSKVKQLWVIAGLPGRCAQEPTALASVFVVAGNDLSGAFVFAGNSSANSGLSNPACAKVRPGLSAAVCSQALPSHIALSPVAPEGRTCAAWEHAKHAQVPKSAKS